MPPRTPSQQHQNIGAFVAIRTQRAFNRVHLTANALYPT
jgi:hypothetical protein